MFIAEDECISGWNGAECVIFVDFLVSFFLGHMAHNPTDIICQASYLPRKGQQDKKGSKADNKQPPPDKQRSQNSKQQPREV